MYVAPVRYPGTSVKFGSDNANRDVESLLRLMTDALGDAAIALSWFEADRMSENSGPDWNAGSALRTEARDIVRRRRGDATTFDIWRQQHEEAEDLALQLAMQRHHTPMGYRHRMVFIHARTFVFALDAIEKALRALSRTHDAPPAISKAEELWDTSFPSLKAVRDSAHHLEDRARGLGRRGNPLDLRPIDNEIASGATVLSLGALMKSTYVLTTAAGDLGEVDVTAESLSAAQRVVQAALRAFEWDGESRLHPTV